MAAIATKFTSWLVNDITRWADDGKFMTTLNAELSAFRIIKLALRAIHVDPRSRGMARYMSEKSLLICEAIKKIICEIVRDYYRLMFIDAPGNLKNTLAGRNILSQKTIEDNLMKIKEKMMDI